MHPEVKELALLAMDRQMIPEVAAKLWNNPVKRRAYLMITRNVLEQF